MGKDILDPDDLNELHRDILLAIGWWYNAVPVITVGKRYQLGVTIPPDLKEVVKSRLIAVDTWDQGDWEQKYKWRYYELQEDGWLGSTKLLRKSIDWDPGRLVRQVIVDHLDTEAVGRYMPPHLDRQKALAGDLNESLKHRHGVEMVVNGLPTFGWEITDVYPGSGAEQRFDVHAELDGEKWAVEVLCEHHGNNAYAKKYRQAQASERNVFYVFQNTKVMNRCFSTWTRKFDCECDLVNYPLNANQRSRQDARSYLERSLNDSDRATTGISQADTMLGFYKKSGL